MTRFIFVRHAAHDAVGTTLVGNSAGVHLSASGRAEAEFLGECFRGLRAAAVYSSPLDRARETAELIARALSAEVQIERALNEVDFGEWTNSPFATLDRQEEWQRWNSFRSGTRPPGGESMLAVQARVIGALDRWREEHRDQTVVLVSHCDVIRATLAFYLGLPLDLFLRLEVNPASVSMISIDDWSPRILLMNGNGGELEALFRKDPQLR